MGKVSMISDGLENMSPLRTGGQGSVYKGRRTGAVFSAVKILPTPICAENKDDKHFVNFQNEVLKLKKVNEEPNPYVVKILNSGLTDSGGFPFIEMEYIDGPDLEELIKAPYDGIFTIKEIIKVAEQLANALAHCHKSGVKHGDIKSNNVKFNIRSGNYVLLDFGLAVMSDEQRRTSLRYAGAIEFMAPEQSEGEMLFESDVYSFGVVLYELLAGCVPFPLTGSGETARNTVMISHLEAPVPDVMTIRRKNLPESWPEEKKECEMLVPGWLLNVIAKCLSKKPADRYQNGISLYEDIVMKCITAGADNTEHFSNAGSLQRQNEQLHTLLSDYKRNLTNCDLQLSSVRQMIFSIDTEINAVRSSSAIDMTNNKVHIPKAAFMALFCLLLSLSAFTGYSIFSNKKAPDLTGIPPADTAAISKQLDLNTENADIENVSLKIDGGSSGTGLANDIEEKEVPDKTVRQVSTAPIKTKSLKELKREERRREREKNKKGKFIEIKFIK